MKKKFYYVSQSLLAKISLLGFLLFALTSLHPAFSQDMRRITGIVTDQDGLAIIGANVIIEGNSKGTITDVNGHFSIEVPQNSILLISYIGYLQKKVRIAGNRELKIILSEDNKTLDEVVVIGYGAQKKVTLTGAVSAINTDDIVTTKNENVQNSLTGKIAGVRVVQKTSEPGVFSNSFDIRGFGTPLIVIDGVPRDNVERLDPNDIESISVLKDASAAIYGVRAANGVVLVTTKKGKTEKMELNYSGSVGWQVPSGLPKTVGAEDWLNLSNEIAMHNLSNTTPPPYTQEYIDEYRTGAKKSVDWYPSVIKNSAIQTQHNLSASGGSERVNYFISLGYLYQNGLFVTDDLNYERFNVRSNVSAKITNRLKAELKISAIMDEQNQPSAGSTADVFKTLWRMDPIRPIYANDNPLYLGNIPSTSNPLALIDSDISGYKKNKNAWFQGDFSLTYDIPCIKGLQAKGTFSYDYRLQNNKTYKKEYSLYEYQEQTESYKAYKNQSPSTLNRYFGEKPSSLWQISLNYNRAFKKHNVGTLLLYEEQTREGDNFSAQRELILSGLDQLLGGGTTNQIGTMSAEGLYHYANKGLVGRLNYDYASKYIAEFSFRYDGSSKFPKGKQWGFFPAVSAGWRISEESFIRDNQALSFINNLKLRASYGVMGDDGASSYQFITGYNFPATKGGNNQGLQGGYVFDGQFYNGVGFKNLPNPNITWYEVKTFNIGLDADMWKGLLGVQVEYFNRVRDGLLATRRLSLPGTLGAALPQENMNSDLVRGMEITLTHRNRIGDWTYNLSGNFSFTKSRILDYDQAVANNSYDHWKTIKANRNPNIGWGYDYDGQFQNYNDIYNSQIDYGGGNIGRLPGDYKYKDWNGDGVIDANDNHPISGNFKDWNGDGKLDSGSIVPQIYFGLNVGVQYKGFDLNVLLQGTAMTYVSYPEQLAAPLVWGGNALEYFLDRWHPEDPMADPYHPSTKWISGKYCYTTSTPQAKGTKAIQNASYLRLKTLELGYTLPKSVTNMVGIKNARLYFNGYNLLTFSGLKYVDPEHPADSNGYTYPLNKTFNIGLNIKF